VFRQRGSSGIPDLSSSDKKGTNVSFPPVDLHLYLKSCLKIMLLEGKGSTQGTIVWPNQCPNFYSGSFHLENKLNTLISENDRFRNEINADQRHGSFSAHFRLVLDRTKPIPSF
jgi:hypothetical protein